MLLTLAIFRQLIALKRLWKVFENRQQKSLKVFEFFGLGDYETWLYTLLIIHDCVNDVKYQEIEFLEETRQGWNSTVIL
jgi:hypothetical protein